MKYLGVKGHDECDLPKLFRKCMCVFGERETETEREKIKQCDKILFDKSKWRV